ncbi:amidohydrolase family protein [Acetobacteraceae bacterium H6797]|nr:amidohydrolase family protein [Acetobacteraceae bacterium H6797]
MTAETCPAPGLTAPRNAVPAGACDTHTHVFGPFDRFPPAMPSVYALPEADAATHAAMLATLGARRGCLVQPAPYGSDPSAMLDALHRAKGRLRGVMACGPEVTDKALAEMHEGGVRALRFVEMRAPNGGRYPGSIGTDALEALAPRMKELGWQAHLWAKAEDHAAMLPRLSKLGIPLVLDHMGSPDPATGPAAPAFAALLDYLRDGEVWIKLSLCRVSRQKPGYADARPLHDALIAANPDRLLWGSDWPYVRMGDLTPDAGALLDLFIDWTGDEALVRRILVENPQQLFAFDD